MKGLVIASLFAATELFAQPVPLPTIIDVHPTQGAVNGGDVVFVTAENLVQGDFLPINYVITFDGVPAKPARITSGGGCSSFAVITPPHARGIAQIALTVPDWFVSKSGFIFSYAGINDANAPFDENFETVLVPISTPSTPVAGAFGSRWTTELWVSNTGDDEVVFFHDFPTCTDADVTTCAGKPFPALPPHSVQQFRTPPDPTSAGYLFYVQKGAAQNVQFSLRLRDVSRSTVNAGTELPVLRVPPIFFLLQPALLVNVPVASVSRTSLRIIEKAKCRGTFAFLR